MQFKMFCKLAVCCSLRVCVCVITPSAGQTKSWGSGCQVVKPLNGLCNLLVR